MPAENLIDSLGSNLYIGPKGDLPTPGASPDPWVPIGELATVGALAFAANEVRSTALTRIQDNVNKGVEPMPAVALTFNKISGGDDGQEALAAAKTDRSQDQWYWFKLELPDTADASGSTPTTVTFKAKVMAYTPFSDIAPDGTMQGGASIVVDEDTFTETPAA